MAKQKSAADRLFTWLKENLGPHCLAPLTSVDAAALKAAVQIADTACYTDHHAVFVAFGSVVFLMQSKTRYLAYHSIAMVRDWSDRSRMWAAAKLPPLESIPRCAYEPGGSAVS